VYDRSTCTTPSKVVDEWSDVWRFLFAELGVEP